MRFSIFLAGLFATSGAQAHVGHLGELAAHDHWVAAGALGAAIALAAWTALKGGKSDEKPDEEATDETLDETPDETLAEA